tara:strand:+ start:1239 stop:1499 length:261 start_codon:yes stop_codon:yes gene_type:complete
MTKNKNNFGTFFVTTTDFSKRIVETNVDEQGPEDKLKSGECRNKIIRKILKMKLTPSDLAWLAEGLMDIVSEMDEAGVDYSDEVEI